MSQYPPGPSGQYPPNAGGYPPNQGGYPPNAGGYLPNYGGYPPNAGGYPPSQGGYPTKTDGNAPSFPAPQQNPMPNPNVQGPQGGYPPPGNQDPPPGGYPPNDKLPMDGEPCAPSLGDLANLPGYEGLTMDNAALKPPSYDESMYPKNVPQEVYQNAPSLTEDEAREAAIQFVSEHCCYGSKAAKEMNIRDIRFKSAIHYKLETYGEKRETAWASEPYKGQDTLIQAGGYTPGPWDIQVPNEVGNFQNIQKYVEVPNTTNVKPCHKCMALGRVRCKHCFGFGSKSCTWCNGRGHRTQFDRTEDCTSCRGTGRDRCIWCQGNGHTICDVCKGHCQLRYYIKLTVTWENHIDDHISDTADLPKELIRDVTGQTAFEDEQPRVWPISHFPDPAVNVASQNLVEKHRHTFTNERILMQRQQVRIIPSAEVAYSWNGKEGKYFVYGYEKRVYFPDYPQSCCCGCQIL